MSKMRNAMHSGRARRGWGLPRVSFHPGATLLVLIVMLGCSSSTTPEEERRTGLLTQTIDGHIVLPLSIEAPDSVGQGTSFVVGITTYGTRACSRIGETETTLRNDTTVVVPFDYHAIDDRPCPDVWDNFLHEVTLTADHVEPMIIEVQGLRDVLTDDSHFEPVVYHREVVITNPPS
jgi:hypothetical protein